MIHIAFVEDSLLHGGTQIWVTDAMGKLRARGYPVTAVVPAGSWVEEKSRGAGARVVTYDWDTVGPDNADSQATWIEALRDADVVVQTVNPPRRNFQGVVFAAECLRSGNLPAHLIPKSGTIVPSYHAEYYRPDPSVPTTILAITGFTRRHMIDVYGHPEDMVELIYQGTDVRRFTSSKARREEAATRYPVPHGAGPVLGCVGTYEDRKGQLQLLDAMKHLLAERLPNARLILVGDGPDEDLVRARISELELQHAVNMYPFTNALEFAYEMMDLLIVPSTHKEGLPNVLIEAMSMGVPAVASRLAGIPELVVDDETGRLVTPGDVVELADAVRDVWNDRAAFARMQKNAGARMRSKFDSAIQFERFVELLERCGSA